MSARQLEANVRDWQLEHFGLLDPDQPNESAHIEHVRRMNQPFPAQERRLIRAAIGETPE